MPLHRDIHWIGRQWAVTGHGMQLIDQKLKGFFDIEASRLWEEALVQTMRAKEWLNVADFEKGLEVARKRFPRADVTQALPAEVIAPPVAATVPVALQAPAIQAPATDEPEPASSMPPQFHMRFLGIAKFIRPWRVRARK